jgi:hypothetical protein
MTDQTEPQNTPAQAEPVSQPAQPAAEQSPPPDASPFARPNMDLVNKGEDSSKWERR